MNQAYLLLVWFMLESNEHEMDLLILSLNKSFSSA